MHADHTHPPRRLYRVDLAGPSGHLEALFLEPLGSLRGLALVCHPHPLHGGTLHTKAVYRTARGLVDDGFGVLRFNFRGVGRSAGRFDHGRGEIEDARAAWTWLEEHDPGLPRLLGGFSFGSHIALQLVASGAKPQAFLGIGIPLGLEEYDFSYLARLEMPMLFVVGSRDPFCPAPKRDALLQRLRGRATLHIVPGAGHLLTEDAAALQRHVREFAARAVPRPATPGR